MTKTDRKTLQAYIRLLADEMRLRDWTIELDEEPAEAQNSATIRIVYGRKLAYLMVPPAFRSETPEDQRHTLIHELVHVHLESAASAVRSDLEPLLGRPADTVFWEGFKRQYEYGVDGLADAIAPRFPLIDWDAS